jgi:hypothetical protein
MPDSDPTSSSSQGAPYEPRHLPVPVPPPRENGRLEAEHDPRRS